MQVTEAVGEVAQQYEGESERERDTMNSNLSEEKAEEIASFHLSPGIAQQDYT